MLAGIGHKTLPALGCVLLAVVIGACGGETEADIEATVEAVLIWEMSAKVMTSS